MKKQKTSFFSHKKDARVERSLFKMLSRIKKKPSSALDLPEIDLSMDDFEMHPVESRVQKKRRKKRKR